MRELTSWTAPTGALEHLRQEYLTFVAERGPAALRREAGPQHLTASCFIFSADLRQTLLCFHRKGRFWVQTGGHVEPEDASLAAAALREAGEESGLSALSLVPGVLDLDRHTLGAGFGACGTHWDVGFAAVAPSEELPRVSDESEQVAPGPPACVRYGPADRSDPFALLAPLRAPRTGSGRCRERQAVQGSRGPAAG